MSQVRSYAYGLAAIAILAVGSAGSEAGKGSPQLSPLEKYVQESMAGAGARATGTSAGSLWSPSSRLTDLGRDNRASQAGDIVTIYVAERASAVAKGTTKSGRQSAASGTITALGGLTKAAGPLANLVGAESQTQLNGEAETSRETVLTTTLAARVTQVLPNGNLVLEAAKDIQVNSEKQTVTVRGVVRPSDLSAQNVVRSDRVAYLEVHINGKGVVGDAIKRPFILYRLLLGLLPF